MPDPRAHTLLQSERLSRDFVAVGVEDTVEAALAKIRAAPETREIFYCYACDPAGRLVGVVPIRKLIRALPGERIDALMSSRIVALPIDAPDSLVEDFFVTYRFLAFPVVDTAGRIEGVLEVNQLVDTLSESMFEDDVAGRVRGEIFQFVGLPQDELTVARGPLRRALRRLPWLLVNIAGGMLAATQARLFDSVVAKVAGVAAFIPMTLVLSESLGVQTTAVSASMVAGSGWDPAEIRREIASTTLAGIGAAALVAALGTLFTGSPAFGASLLLAIACSTFFASLVGALLPRVFRRFRVDPHLASAPLVLAFSDNVTLLIYFGLVAVLTLR